MRIQSIAAAVLAVMSMQAQAADLLGDTLTFTRAQEPVGLGERRLRIDRSGPFLTVFLPHSWAMVLQIRQELSSLGPILAIDAPSPTGSQPSADTPWLVWNPVSTTTTVTANSSDTISWSTSAILFNIIDPGASDITWTLAHPTGYIAAGDIFDGYTITGLSNDLASVSLSSNNTGLGIGLSHSARQINIALQGNNGANTSFVLSVAVVPEPSSWALLTAGLLAVGTLARRKQSSKAKS